MSPTCHCTGLCCTKLPRPCSPLDTSHVIPVCICKVCNPVHTNLLRLLTFVGVQCLWFFLVVCIRGMYPMTNSRNCTCQQSSVNCRDQCVWFACCDLAHGLCRHLQALQRGLQYCHHGTCGSICIHLCSDSKFQRAIWCQAWQPSQQKSAWHSCMTHNYAYL